MRGARSLRIMPPGIEGLDLHTAPDLVPLTRITRGENVRAPRQALERRGGRSKIATLTDVTAAAGALVFGSTSVYGKVAAAAHLLIPKGGFGVRIFFRVSAPSGGNTGHLLASRVTGKAYGPLSFTMSDARVLTAAWRLESDESEVAISSSALTAGTDHSALLTYDPYSNGGESRLYVDGAEDGTAVTGIGEDEQPMQDGPDYYFGILWDPDAGPAAPVANSQYTGALDACTLFSFAGRKIAQAGPGGSTLLATLRRQARQDWPNPQSAMVRWHYGFDGTVATQAILDASRFQNHLVLTGTPASAAAVALRAVNGQYVGTLQRTSGEALNVVAAGGRASTESVREATS